MPNVGHDVAGRFGVGENVRDFFAPMRRQRQHRDHANAQQREECDDEFDRVGQLEHHPIERPKSEIDQAAGQPVDRDAQLGIAQAALVLHQRDALGRGGGRAAQHVVERDVSPITLPPVAASKFLGPSCASLQHLPAGFRAAGSGADQRMCYEVEYSAAARNGLDHRQARFAGTRVAVAGTRSRCFFLSRPAGHRSKLNAVLSTPVRMAHRMPNLI